MKNQENKKELSRLKSQQQEILREVIARRGKQDLAFLIENILNDPDDSRYLKLAPFHHELIAELNTFWNSDEEFFLAMLPRGSLKTSLLTIAWSIQRILNNPNVRILITSERGDNSRKFLREISEHFERNPRLRYYYGNWMTTEQKWTEFEIVVSKRTQILKEPTVATGSTEQSPVSAHFDLILIDDLVSRSNTMTADQIRKTKQYFRDLLSVRDKGTKILTTGTFWSFNDLYCELLRGLTPEKDFINGQPATRERIAQFV